MDRNEFSRRRFLYGATCIAALGVQSKIGWAELQLGASARITTMSDGYLSLPSEMVFSAMPKEELRQLLDNYKVDATKYEPECNVAIYQDDQNSVLFDVGAGPDFMPTSGKLLEALETTDLSPEDISHVIFTHAHPDHIWGVLDDFGDLLFPNATHHFGRSEWDYWWNPSTVDTIGEDRAAFAVGAKRRMEAIEDQVAFFDDGQEILPGIAARASFGHTPGHMAFEIRSGGESVMIVGDALGNPHVAFERPDWHSGTDQDPQAAAATRNSLLDQISHEQMKIIGFHLPNGGIGRIEKTGSAYKFIGKQ